MQVLPAIITHHATPQGIVKVQYDELDRQSLAAFHVGDEVLCRRQEDLVGKGRLGQVPHPLGPGPGAHALHPACAVHQVHVG